MSQGAQPGNYPKAYLITAPRCLGYTFNPVSFWYLYSKDMHLRAMILEVNNTFDERRMYFLKGPSEIGEARLGSPDAKVFSVNYSWPKDFHVSPFNSRRGSYSLTADDPFLNEKAVQVNNVITLSSSKDHPKIVARLFSSAPAIDPQEMSFWQKVRFLGSWWWVGFVTYPRIVKEAAKLFFRRGLHVWFRPEVAKTSIGRRESQRERLVDMLIHVNGSG